MRNLGIGQTFWIPASKVVSLLPPRDMEIMQGRPEALQSLIVQLMPEMISKDEIRELRGLEEASKQGKGTNERWIRFLRWIEP